jgi:hypothetical protein
MSRCLAPHSAMKIVGEYLAHRIDHKPLQIMVDEKAPRGIRNSGHLTVILSFIAKEYNCGYKKLGSVHSINHSKKE